MNNLNVLIFGATGGIGRAICKKLKERGAQLYLLGRSETKLKNLAKSLGLPSKQYFKVSSLTTEPEITAVQQWLQENGQQFQLGIHCVGRGSQQRADQLTLGDITQLLEINLTSAFTFYSLFSQFKSNDFYDLVYIGSASTEQIWPKNTLYGAAKAGLEYFAQSLQKEIKQDRGKVWLYKAGSVNTDFFNNLKNHLPPQKMIQPEELADLILQNLSLPRQLHFPSITVRSD